MKLKPIAFIAAFLAILSVRLINLLIFVCISGLLGCISFYYYGEQNMFTAFALLAMFLNFALKPSISVSIESRNK